MKVKDLIKLLLEQNLDAEIVIASDAEANSISPFAELDEAVYVPHNSYSGELRSVEEDMTEKCADNGKLAVVLYPIN